MPIFKITQNIFQSAYSGHESTSPLLSLLIDQVVELAAGGGGDTNVSQPGGHAITPARAAAIGIEDVKRH